MNHAHVEAGVFSILATLLAYGIAWLFNWNIPALIFNIPAFLVIFVGLYLILYVVFLIAWNR
jgi:hypothetical protein